MAPPHVLIVGAGVTGSALALLLKDMGLPVRVLEKSRGAGGRMATHRLRRGGRDTPIVGRADLGAQYITTRSPPDHATLGPIYKSLLDAGVLRPFDGEVAGPNPYGGAGDEVRHYAAPGGLQAVAEHFLERSGAEVQWDCAVRTLELQSDGGCTLQLACASDGAELAPIAGAGAGGPRIVVLTQPVAQVLGRSKFPLGGNFLDGLDADTSAALAKVEYSSRFAAAYFFDSSVFSWPHGWTCHYFDTGDVRYVAHDTGKRGATEESMVSVLVHSGVPLGIELKDDQAPFTDASARLLADLEKKMPEVPWAKAASVKVHKWLYSQVYKGIGARRPDPAWVWDSGDGGFPGCVELFRTGAVLGFLAGDALAPAGNFEGCVFSATRAAAAIRGFAEALAGAPRSDL